MTQFDRLIFIVETLKSEESLLLPPTTTVGVGSSSSDILSDDRL